MEEEKKRIEEQINRLINDGIAEIYHGIDIE